MSTLIALKDYLLGKDDDIGYLLKPEHNGKTVMLSCAWGSGKTHFWQKDIAPELVENFKNDNRACVYVSLYGKESLKAIKQEVFLKASDETNYLSEEVETFGIDALSSLEDSDANWAKIVKSFWDLNETRRGQKGQNRLKDGGIICFDDFERKSKKVDLNDLFGFISQLAIGLNCKVVIILNSDVFKSEEANVFKTVKEKTVNKFFYFEPERRELFDSIYDRKDTKYEDLDAYREDIFNAIDETKELNARIYIQVLDNCLEWIDIGYENIAIRALVLSTIYFIKTNSILSFPDIKIDSNSDIYALNYIKDLDTYDVVSTFINNFGYKYRRMGKSTFYEKLIHQIHTNKKHSNVQESDILEWLKNNYDNLFMFVEYGYKLYIANGIDKDLYLKLSEFIKSGILPQNKESSS